jgi:mono/diheme cytochrome c family protein
MKKRFLGLLMLTGTLIMLLTSCEYDFIVPAPEAVAPPPDSDTISFSTDIQPIFTANCVSCHQGGIAPDLREGKSYSALVPDFVVAGEAENSSLYTKCATGGSMAGFIVASDLALMKRWINAGAKND